MEFETKFDYEKVWQSTDLQSLQKMIENAMPESPVDDLIIYIKEALEKKAAVHFLDFSVRKKN